MHACIHPHLNPNPDPTHPHPPTYRRALAHMHTYKWSDCHHETNAELSRTSRVAANDCREDQAAQQPQTKALPHNSGCKAADEARRPGQKS
eukprot:6198731-Pleurochrysis_carterae.AAC.1